MLDATRGPHSANEDGMTDRKTPGTLTFELQNFRVRVRRLLRALGLA